MENNLHKKKSLKNWFIKKILSNESTREDILNYIATIDKDE